MKQLVDFYLTTYYFPSYLSTASHEETVSVCGYAYGKCRYTKVTPSGTVNKIVPDSMVHMDVLGLLFYRTCEGLVVELVASIVLCI